MISSHDNVNKGFTSAQIFAYRYLQKPTINDLSRFRLFTVFKAYSQKAFNSRMKFCVLYVGKNTPRKVVESDGLCICFGRVIVKKGL